MSGDAATIWEGPTTGTIPVVNNAGSMYEEVQVAILNQTVFTLATFNYTPNTRSIFVYKKTGAASGGEMLRRGVDYAETSTSKITLTAPCLAGDVLYFTAFAINQLTPPVTFNGLPPGGSVNQILSKLSNSDYDAVWASIVGIPTLLDGVRQNVASAPTVDLTPLVTTSRNIQITGAVQISGFQITNGQLFAAKFSGALTIKNNASIVTQTGADINVAPGDTCFIRATAANVVEIISYNAVYGKTFVNVKTFGAKGDGVTDDTTAINTAITACTLIKAALYFPGSIYNISAAVSFGNIILCGDGTWSSYIVQTGAAANAINVDCNYASGGGLRDLSIHAGTTNPGQTRSSGIGLKVNRANGNWLCMNVDINGFATGIQSAANFYTYFKAFEVLNASTVGIHCPIKPVGAGYQDSAGVFFDTAKVSNFGTASINTGSTGILIESASGDHWTSVDVTVFNNGVKIAPAATAFVSHLFFNRVLADTCINTGWIADGTNGNITNINCIDCWAGFNTNGFGVQLTGPISKIDDFKWIGGNIRENGQHGVIVSAGKKVLFLGAAIASNSKLTTLTYMGLYVSGANVVSVNAKNCNIGNFSTTAAQKQLNNLYIDAAVTGTVTASDCDLSDFGAGGAPYVNLSASVTLSLRDNLPSQSGVDRVGGEILRGIAAANLAAGSTNFMGPNGATATEANSYWVTGRKGSLTELTVALSAAPGGAVSNVFTVRINNVDTLAIATVTGAAFSASWFGNITFAKGDFISIRAVYNGASVVSTPRWYLEMSG